MRLIVAGDRDLTWHQHAIHVRDALQKWTAFHWRPTVILCGCATGADALGAHFAMKAGVPVEPHPADWDRLGGAAGPQRNAHMVASADGLLVVRFPWSSGSRNVFEKATEKGLLVMDMMLDERLRPAGERFPMPEGIPYRLVTKEAK